MSAEDTNDKLQAIQETIDSLQAELDRLRKELPDPETRPGAKKRLDDLREDTTMFFSRAFTRTDQQTHV